MAHLSAEARQFRLFPSKAQHALQAARRCPF